MLDLVWKDVVAGRRAFLVVIALGVLQLAVSGSVGPVFLPTAFLFSGVFAFSPVFLEETQHTETLWNSLPVTRGRIVAARYLSVVLGIVVGLGLSWTVGQAVTRLMRSGGGGPAGAGDVHAMALLFVVLITSILAFRLFDQVQIMTRGGPNDATTTVMYEAVQAAFVQHGAVQCGFCTPGMIVSAVELLEHHPGASEAEIRRALGGHICRCTGYTKIVEAIQYAAEKLQAAEGGE